MKAIRVVVLRFVEDVLVRAAHRVAIARQRAEGVTFLRDAAHPVQPCARASRPADVIEFPR